MSAQPGDRRPATGVGNAEPTAPNRSAVFAAACAGIFVFGIVLALLGTLFGLPEMRTRMGLDLARQGDVFLLLYAGILASTIVAGPVIDRFGTKALLAISSLLVAVALFGFVGADRFLLAALSALLLGLGGGGLNTANNVLVSDLFDRDRGPRLNVLGTFFGVGALVIPLTAATLASQIGIGTLLTASAVLSLLSGAAYALLAFPPPPARQRGDAPPTRFVDVLRWPGVLLFASLLFCQSGNEASIGGWTSTYIGEMGWSPTTATSVLAGYWAALMVGRIVAARILGRVPKSRVVLASAIGSAVGGAMLIVSSSLWLLSAGVAIVGLSYASVYPTTLAMVGDRYHQRTGSVFGALFSIALVGGMAFPWVVGHLGQAAGVRSAMLLPVLGALMIAVLITVIERRTARARSG